MTAKAASKLTFEGNKKNGKSQRAGNSIGSTQAGNRRTKKEGENRNILASLGQITAQKIKEMRIAKADHENFIQQAQNIDVLAKLRKEFLLKHE